ncbi:MAG TPA: sigma 54-interacting transcriptional regulator [Syntrophorhabdales bacterium]|nr:sigma 54-interacting transcriptional regulator [Syntrophorhabdales bacterium]
MKTFLRVYSEAIIDTIMDGVIVVNPEGNILSVNKAVERMTGYSAAELVGQSCTILKCDKCFSLDGEGHMHVNCELYHSGSIMGRRCCLQTKDGRPLYALKNAAVLKAKDGALIGGVETLTDITSLVEKEQTIKELADLVSPGRDVFEGIVGRSPSMLALYDLIMDAAASDVPVIVYGESGTGKELVANAIHALGKRSRGPFIKVSCAALSESLLESELFGHVKGAFTGADRDRRGRFEASHGGDLFMDEIGDIPLSTQVKLLRVLQEKKIEKVGDLTPIPVDTRIIAATHRNLWQMCQEGRFREDLYYRLNVVPISVPPLRERPEDIPLLVHHLVRGIRLRTDKAIQGITEETMKTLITHAWPGNVRELINALEYAFVVCHDAFIAPQHLPSLSEKKQPSIDRDAGRGVHHIGEKDLVAALEKSQGNKAEAARLLGISRVTLWKLLKKYDITAQLRVDVQDA